MPLKLCSVTLWIWNRAWNVLSHSFMCRNVWESRLCYILCLFLISCSGACVQIPGAPVQRGPYPQRDEWSGEEEHSPNPRLMYHTGLCCILSFWDLANFSYCTKFHSIIRLWKMIIIACQDNSSELTGRAAQWWPYWRRHTAFIYQQIDKIKLFHAFLAVLSTVLLTSLIVERLQCPKLQTQWSEHSDVH